MLFIDRADAGRHLTERMQPYAAPMSPCSP